ncbi:acetyl-CoA carboxylase biotin carboxyl carrier protein [Schlesneria paludicola]|uniref:acetyl-CoA carboxylase biotin carboxyl carrier protein n=1 Tax=Schlesneria paludicola TaxID=360056 RepID=UPI00029AC626|nr:acetyl-CoA carboxylase biotin carboxyl carrier protein [Schlesneria paludicola]
MAEPTSTGDAPFDLNKLQQLVEMMEKHGLSEVHLRRGDEQWRLRRGAKETLQFVPQQPAYFAPQAAPATPPTVAATAPAPAPAASAAPAAPADAGGLLIKSPTIGTFYATPTPTDPPFVSVGSVVTPETVVCTIEQMKVFNQIQAGVSGTITAVLVKSGDAVEFDTPLFRYKS